MTEKTANASYENLLPKEIGEIFFRLSTELTSSSENERDVDTTKIKLFLDQFYDGKSTTEKFIKIIQQIGGMHPNSTIHTIDHHDITEESVMRFTALCYDQSENWYKIQIDLNNEGKISNFSAFPSTPPRPEGRKISKKEIYELLNEFVDNLVTKDDFSGNILVAEGDNIEFELSRGFRDREFKVPHNQESRFNLGSMPKMFTATTIGYLIDQKKISVNDKVGSILSDIELSDEIKEITIHQLLTHTSGLGNYWEEMEGRKSDFVNISAYQEFLSKATLGKITHGILYSNLGFQTLGMIIEKVTGEDFFDVIHKVIFDPLEMQNTSYPMFDEVDNDLLSIPYSKRAGQGQLIKVDWPSKRGSAAGGCISTTYDLFKFFRGLFDGKILSEKTLEEFTTGKVNMVPDGSIQYAYGFGFHKIYNLYSIGHNGGSLGINADGRYFSNDFTIIVLVNRDPSLAGKVVDHFSNLLTQLID